ncbi:T9SS outer membrane translocon Sov/SprA [Caldithrix abyssi]
MGIEKSLKAQSGLGTNLLHWKRLIFLFFALSLPIGVFSQIGIRIPPPPKSVRLFEPSVEGLARLKYDSTLFVKKPRVLRRQVTMDSTARFVAFREAIDGTDIFLPAVVDLETYIKLRLKYDTQKLWRQALTYKFGQQTESGFGAIKLDIPLHIKSKTFTRIFGSDRIGLKVTGNISFDLSGRSEKRSGSAISALENQNTFSPRFKQTQQFTVEGKIGEKVTVSVEQNSEATVDIENTLKLRYDGDEDEIVQSIEAGNISLSLPATKYVIFGGSNKGLFGLKSKIQVGNLYMTTIASLEKGQQQELTISGSAKESSTTIRDYEFIKNRYFFIDNFYRDHFEDGLKDDPQTFSFVAGTEVLQLEVWVSTSYADDGVRRGVATIDPWAYLDADLKYQNIDLDTVATDERTKQTGYFRQLIEGKDFYYDKYRGFFWLNQGVENNQILAVAYATANAFSDPNVPTVGTMSETLQDTSQAVILKMIKPRQIQPSYEETWPLMMRNVYFLGGTNIEKSGFELRIENNVNGTHQIYPEGSDRTYLNLLELDLLDENGNRVEGGDEKVDYNPYIIDFKNGILIFPSLQPFNPEPGSRFAGRLPEKDLVDMYRLNNSNSSEFVKRSKFEIIVTSKSTKSTFDLGFYVLEGSEVVTLGGRTLTRDKDYIIDYFTGQLTLLSPEAKRSSSNIEIKYERANLFQLDKKTIFGTRLEYRFWEKSFIGFTALYMNKSTLDQRVRVGQEPFRNFVWDINASFDFKPRIITRLLDKLPIVETNAESRIKVEGEFAQVLPNPNTLNNKGTGDDNGVAYIDDFEASKRTTTLGIRYRTWTMASVPSVIPTLNETPIEALGPQERRSEIFARDRARAHIVWFNPYRQVPIKDIWPNRDVNAQTGQTTNVLGIDIWRDKGSDPDSAWAGIMRSTASFANQEKTKYIELWILGNQGTVHIDIGQISEDWYIRGKNWRGEDSYGNLNTEDKNTNGLLEEDEDVGLDGIPNGQPGDDPNDDWHEVQLNAWNRYDGVLYDGINGTEGNSQAREARYPDTEDLDGDGDVSTVNSYFEYSFSLDGSDENSQKWLVGSTEKGWRQFRIPIKDYTRAVNNPDTTFQQILNVRLWFSDIPEEERTRILIATFDFVGNEWEETGIARDEKSDFVLNDSLFSLAVYNTEENVEEIPGGPEPYHSPPGVTGVRDRITRALSKEQSLVMRFFGLQPGEIAEARKQLYQRMSLVDYKKLKMFVHGDRMLPADPPEYNQEGIPLSDPSPIRFYLRFGSDDKNYYEYGQDVYAHWHPDNNIEIDLDELAAIKSDEAYNVGTVDSLVYLRKLPGRVEAYYKAVGKPSLNTIRYFIIGVKHRGDEPGRSNEPFVGEIWLDEMRLSDVRKVKATAMRLLTSMKFADVFNFNAQWESKDADFHNVSKQFGSGNTDERQNYSAKLFLHKFLPDFLDLSIPIDARASFSRSIPKYVTNTDQLTHYQNDTFTKKLKSLFGLRKLPEEMETITTKSEVYGIGTTIKKRSKSKFWLLRYTLDGITFDVDYSKKKSSNWETAFNRSELFKESFVYSAPLGRNKGIEPFKFLKKVPLLKRLSSQKFYYMPSQLSFNVSITDNKKELLRRSNPKLSVTKNINTTRSFRLGYKMLNSLDFSFSRNYTSDADVKGYTHKKLINRIFSKGDFGLDTNIRQQFQGNYKPTLFKWLKPSFSFSSNFNYQLIMPNEYKNASNSINKRLDLTFNPGEFIKTIYNPRKKQPAQRSGSRRRRSIRRPKQQDQKQTEKKEEKKKTFSFPNPLMWVYNTIASWSNIRTSISQDERVQHRYLADMPSWEYQFGFTRSPGIPQDSTLNVNLVGPVESKTLSIRTSTSFKILNNVRASLKHDMRSQESRSDYGKAGSGSKTTSYFFLGDDPKANFRGLASINAFIPDWNVQISGLEKMFFFPKFARSISITHAHNSKYTENLTLKLGGGLLPTTQTFTNAWQPLVGVNISTKWGVTGTIRYTSTTNYSYSTSGGATKSAQTNFNLSFSYSRTQGFRLPIWPFNNKKFKNEINFNLTFDASSSKTFQRQFGEDKFIEKQSNSNWKLRPAATYRFSSRVQGSLFYETGVSKNKISGKYSYNEFGITVNIAIRD